MKSFKQYITEAKKGNGPFPVSDADKKTLQRQTRASTESGEKIRQGLESAKERTSRTKRTVPSAKKLGVTPRILDAPDGTKVVTNMPEPARGTTGEVVDRVVNKLKTTGETKSGGRTASSSRPRGATAKSGDVGSFIRGEQSKGRPVSGTMQDVAGRKGAGYDFPKDAGTEKPRRTKPGSYVVDDKPKTRSARRISTATNVKPTGRLSKGNLVFPGDTSGAYAAAKAKIKPSEGVKQADISKSIKARLQSARTARTTPPTVARVNKFIKGQEKGYIGKSGTPTAQGVQNYATRSATKGYGDANYDAAKRGVSDPKAASKSVDNLVSRAAGGDKAARSTVKKTYKKITQNYPDIVPSSSRTKAGFSALSDTKPAASTPAAPAPKASPAPKAPKVDDTPKSSRATSKSVSKGGGASTGGKPPVLTKSRIQKQLKLAPTPVAPASTSAPKSKVTTNLTPGPGAPTKPGGLTDFLKKAEKLTKIPAGSRVPSSGGKSKGTTPVKVDLSKAKFGMGPGRSITKTGGSRLRVPKNLADKVKKSLTSRRAEPSLGVGSQSVRKDSVTLPKSATASKTALRSNLAKFGGRALGAGFAAYDTYQGYKTARSKGFDKTTSVARGATRAGSGAAGGALGAKAGAALGTAILPGLGTVAGGLVGGAVGYAAGSGLADKVLNFFDKKRGIKAQTPAQRKPGQLPKQKKKQPQQIPYTGT